MSPVHLRVAWAACLVAAALAVEPARAQMTEVPADLQHALLLRALTFDRRLDRMGDEVVLVVVHQPGLAASVAAAQAYVAAAAASGLTAVEGRRVRVVEIAWSSGVDLVRSLRDAGADVVWLAPTRGADVRGFARAAADAGILTATGVPEYMGQGIGLCVARRDDRPRILVDLDAVRRAGSDLKAQLLKLADVLE